MASKTVIRPIAERPCGGPDHVEKRDCLDEILNENFLLTLTQLNQELRQRLPRNDLGSATALWQELWKECCFVSNWPVLFLRIETVLMSFKTDWTMPTGSWAMLWWTTVFSQTNVGTTFGLQEITEEEEEGNGRTDRSVVSEEEMFLSQWPFDPTMNWFSTVQLLVGWVRKDLMALLGTNKTTPRSWWICYLHLRRTAPAHKNSAIPGPNAELKKLHPHSILEHCRTRNNFLDSSHQSRHQSSWDTRSDE